MTRVLDKVVRVRGDNVSGGGWYIGTPITIVMTDLNRALSTIAECINKMNTCLKGGAPVGLQCVIRGGIG